MAELPHGGRKKAPAPVREQALAFFKWVRGLLAFAVFAAVGAIETDLASTLGAFASLGGSHELGRRGDSGQRDHGNSDQSFHGIHILSWVEKSGSESRHVLIPITVFFQPTRGGGRGGAS